MRSRNPEFGDLFELRVTLRHIKPAIWRGLQVPAELTLGELHQVLQLAFGWLDSHLHEFSVHDIRFGVVDIEDAFFVVDEHAAPLGAVANAGSKLVYRYDFGDGWEHEVKVERVVADGEDAIRCTGGARACPPEDCGGAPGFAGLLKALASPKHEEHATMKEWVGRGYDPERFDLAATNKKLAALAKRLGRRRK